jgi:hypothetical protein
MNLHWTYRLTDVGEPQWAAEGLGVSYVVTELPNGTFVLTASDLAGGTTEVSRLSRQVGLQSEQDAKRQAQNWYDNSLGVVDDGND